MEQGMFDSKTYFCIVEFSDCSKYKRYESLDKEIFR